MAQSQLAQPEARKILAGPGKFDLMASLFDSTSQCPRRVHFNVEGDRFEAQINMVEREDGSGESWNLVGTGSFSSGGKPLAMRHFKAYYRTGGGGRDKGVITLER